MFVARTCHLPFSITLFCKDTEHHDADTVPNLMGLGVGDD